MSTVVLPESTIDRVRRVIADEAAFGRVNLAKVARMTGVSLPVVRGVYYDRRHAKYRTVRPAGHALPDAESYVRCPGCGGNVQLPCQLCAIRKLKAATGQATGGG